MLNLLKIRNVALIDELVVEFGSGLNLLTGETGSGKSIIVDSLGALTGDRVSTDLIKQGEDTAVIEGLFSARDSGLNTTLIEVGIEPADELIVRREISLAGRNRIFVNGSPVTQGFLKLIGPQLAGIHGQGEHTALYDIETHIAMLDDFAGVDTERSAVAEAYREWSSVREQLASLKKDESEKLQLIDILRFQVDEINRAGLNTNEDTELEAEKRRLNNAEKLSSLSGEAFTLLYDDENSTLSTLDRAAKAINELAEYDEHFRGFDEQVDAARAVIAELGATARDFGSSLEFSPARLDEIENRLAEISRLKRKYGETVEAVLEHLMTSEERLSNIETAELREEELQKELNLLEQRYAEAAAILHASRCKAAARFAKQVENDLKDVALEKARFEVKIDAEGDISPNGTDRIEFYFSANPGEPPRPLVRVASGGEASRLMLILKTASRSNDTGKTVVFDEVDVGIGGRVAEAVGRKLKALAATQQVFCVTHQPQIASLADRHYLVEKFVEKGKTHITVRELDAQEKVDEIARMLAGEQITDAARENARTMLAGASDSPKMVQKAQI
ncbi:MAG: DNA repair protein RecN [Pyrinomonadaceae bacterium]|nr:DNA repair protein RecN [Pyrinomonadaceae bacterium]